MLHSWVTIPRASTECSSDILVNENEIQYIKNNEIKACYFHFGLNNVLSDFKVLWWYKTESNWFSVQPHWHGPDQKAPKRRPVMFTYTNWISCHVSSAVDSTNTAVWRLNPLLNTFGLKWDTNVSNKQTKTSGFLSDMPTQLRHPSTEKWLHIEHGYASYCNH